MELKSLRLINFKCFKDSNEIPIHKLTIFVGENDCGKTTILKAIGFFLNDELISPDMFHKIGDQSEKTCEIILTFHINPTKISGLPKEYVLNNEVAIKKIFTLDDETHVKQETLIKRYLFERKELNDLFGLKAAELKALFSDMGLGKYTNAEDARSIINKYIAENFASLGKREGWYPLRWSEVSDFLPHFELYESSDYGNPQGLIEKTLSAVYRKFFYDEDEDGNLTLKSDLLIKKHQ